MEVQGYTDEEANDEVCEEEPDGDDCVVMNEPCISVNALTERQSFQTMRVVGLVNDTRIHILIDSGGIHSFLDITTAKKLGFEMHSTDPQAITVADKNHIACKYKCSDFQ